MSTMIPATIHPDVKSSAEKKIFKLLRDADNTDDWVVLHSLGLARHLEKRRGEIDFLVLCHRGIIVLEVKGGRIIRESGIWKTINRYNEVINLHESPFDQASSAMFSLERDLRNHFSGDPRLSRLLLGYGVIFPDTYEEKLQFGLEGDKAITYTREDVRLPITRYIGRVASFIEDQGFSNKVQPTVTDINKIVNYLRGDFDCATPLKIQASNTIEELLSLTKEQYIVQDSFTNKHRVIIRGSAGTGKTVLALREAVNSIRSNERVLVLCFNRYLAEVLTRSIHANENIKNIEVDSIHHFMHKLISNSTLKNEFMEAKQSYEYEKLYSSVYPEYASLALLEQEMSWDKLIIDEGQDFLTSDILDFLDACIDGGLETGKWRWFMDDNNQAGVYGQYETESVERLENFGATQILSVNCRNTKQIHEETLMLVNPEEKSVAKVNGLPVRYAWYKGDKGQVAALKRQINRALDENISASDIVILSARSLDRCAASKLDTNSVKPFEVDDLIKSNNKKIPYSTISAFKGLESSIVILTDIEKLDSDWWKSVLYVGMSRAKVELIILLPEELKSVYETRLKDSLLAFSDDKEKFSEYF